MFVNCSSLNYIPDYIFGKVSVLNSTFFGCETLQSIKLCLSSFENLPESFFLGCYSLSKVIFIDSTFYGVSLVDCKLSRNAIIELFQSLGEVAYKSDIDLTGNYGTLDLTPQDEAIATSKGWTVIY